MSQFYSQLRYSLLVICISFFSVSLYAQQTGHFHTIDDHPVYNAINGAVESGELTIDEGILQKVYAALQPERLDGRFLHQTDAIAKCLTPVMAEYEQLKSQLSSATVHAIEEIIEESTGPVHNTLQYLSPSGNFVLIYETEGIHSVPLADSNGSGVPDYIEEAAFAADSSYRHQVETLGFRDFLRNDPYEIRFRNMPTYGRTNSSGSTTFITIHNNFQDFPPNTHPKGDVIGALYVTMAHEIKHASQFATSRWHGDSGAFNWIEMDATLMEEVVFPDVNDYYNYIMRFNSQNNTWNQNLPHSNSIFGNPEKATPGAYWHVSWMIYFFEQFGGEWLAELWEQFVEERDLPMLDAFQRVLTPMNTNIEREHLKNHIWHMASGPAKSAAGFGFEDRENYPNPLFSENLAFQPDSLGALLLQPMAAAYVDVQPSNVGFGQPAIRLESDINGVFIGVLGYFRDGTTDFLISVNPNSASQFIQTTWALADLVDMSIAVVNTNRNETAEYSLVVTSTLPEEDLISQNYPNPFNPTTQIEFSLTENKDVRIDVFDMAGRRVATIMNDRLERGFHSVTFDGTGLSSGVYIYRILTDQTAVSKKMVLVK